MSDAETLALIKLHHLDVMWMDAGYWIVESGDIGRSSYDLNQAVKECVDALLREKS